MLSKRVTGRPVIILGAHRFGSEIEQRDVHAIVNRAVEFGIVDIDCAQPYGMGNARQTLGRLPFSTRQRLQIWEKVGLSVTENSNTGTLDLLSTFDRPTEQIRCDVDLAIKTLRIERLASLQLHHPVPDSRRLAVLREILELQAKGVVAELGLSNHEALEITGTVRDIGILGGKISSNQVHLNVAEQRALSEVIPLCANLGIPCIANRSLARGLLSRHHTARTARYQLSSRIQRWNKKSGTHYQIVRACVAECTDLPLPHAMIAWVMAQPNMRGCIVGVSNISQLEEVTAGCHTRLTIEVLQDIDSLILERSSISPTQLPTTMFDKDY